MAAWGATTTSSQKWAYPLAVNVVCPHCGVAYGFSLEHRIHTDHLEHGHPVKVPCPGCGELVRFFIVEAGPSRGEDWTGEMWMHPAPRARTPLGIEGLLSDRLVADYNEALASYSHGLWRGAAQQARTVLEGVVATILDSFGVPIEGPLAARLNLLAEKADLAKPIGDVGDVLREGGNLASHFDERSGIDELLASQMLDLLDAFIEYLILLPTQVARLKERLNG